MFREEITYLETLETDTVRLLKGMAHKIGNM